MSILKALLNNFYQAALGAILVAVVHLIVWGENIREGGTAWMLIFFVLFTVGDAIVWAVRKYRANQV